MDRHLATDKLSQRLLTLTNLGDSEGVIRLYEAQFQASVLPATFVIYAWALLRVGRLCEGFDYLEFRWLIEPFCSIRTTLGNPPWGGEDIVGRTVLIQAEQGYGDEFQFVRFVQLVKAKGATTVFHALPGTEKLMRSVAGVDLVIADGDTAPRFDVHVHLLSLPRLLKSDLASIPNAVPYIHPDPARVAHWAAKLGAQRKLKVGLVWTGRPDQPQNHNRSIPFEFLSTWGNVEGVAFFSLQKGLRGPDYATDLSPDLTDFNETAAVIANMDLVISVCTSVGHLAGAIGKPVWFLVAHPADWRWLVERPDSPWYPTARIFRQRESGRWGEVLEEVKASLHEWASMGTVPANTCTLSTATSSCPVERCGSLAVAETRTAVFEYRRDSKAGRSLELTGDYHSRERQFVCGLVGRGAVTLEVDAGVGTYAVALSKAVGDAGSVLVCERESLDASILRVNLAANHASNVKFVDSTVTVDHLRLDRLDLLHIDTVATIAEEALAGAVDTLWRLRPTIVICCEDDAALRTFSVLIGEFGYRRWRFDAPILLAAPEEVPSDLRFEALHELH